TDTYGYLLDASNSEIESNDDGGLDRNFQISKFITTAGTYYVKVKHHDPSENMGAYSLVTYFDDHNNSKDGATPINPNSRTVGRIEKTGDVDWFKIVIPSGGGTLIVSTTGTIDTSGELYKDGDLNASDNNNGSGNNFKISQQLEAGTYYVKVSASSTGEYWLDSQFIAPVTGSLSDNDNNISTATYIEVNTTTEPISTTGRIDVAGDNDYFKIVTTGPGRLIVKTRRSDGDDIDTYGYLLDANGEELASNNNSGIYPKHFLIVKYITAGTYYVRVRGFNNDVTGDYTLDVQFEPGLTEVSDDQDGVDNNFKISTSVTAGTYYVKVKHHDPLENMGAYSLVTYLATPINPNSRTVGRIEKTGDVDWFKIVIPSGGGTLIVSTIGTIDTSGELYKDGDLSASDDQDGVDNNFKISTSVTAGTYYVKVSASSTGEYWLDSQFIAPVTGSLSDNDNSISTATYIEVNATTEPIPTTGRIDVAGDNDYFKIVTTGPGRLIVKTRGSIDTYGYLLDANGEELASNDNSGIYPKNFQIVKYITAGTYYVRVRGFNNDVTGAYTLDVQFEPGLTEVSDDHSNSIVGATPINPNSRTAGKLDFGQDEDYFKVIIPESGTLTVTTETNPEMDTYGYLYDKKGDAIVRNNNTSNTNTNFRISRSVTAGIYYVKVKGRSRSTTGEYTLVAQFTPDQ
ncbi:MAG: pre-peptidase C-terminal domain-containing protein, partial [Sulfurovum sp.]|nr:pre-peptidase C-terminal domain-containing protein [Sulfurovum sp.]